VDGLAPHGVEQETPQVTVDPIGPTQGRAEKAK
jgi:hypothetical protein